MAVDEFPIYELLVESIFGSVGLALVGIAFVIFLILAFTRTSKIFIIYWLLFYASVSISFYLGGIGLIILYFFAFGFLIINILNLISQKLQ